MTSLKRVLAGGICAVILLLPRLGGAVAPQIEEKVTVAGESSVPGPLVLAGKEVLVEQVVEGDVFVLAQRAVIAGEIRGDLTILAPEIHITGKVTGDVVAL